LSTSLHSSSHSFCRQLLLNFILHLPLTTKIWKTEEKIERVRDKTRDTFGEIEIVTYIKMEREREREGKIQIRYRKKDTYMEVS
jgi:hypothetical protein